MRAPRHPGCARQSLPTIEFVGAVFRSRGNFFRGFGTCCRIGGDRRRAAPVRRLRPVWISERRAARIHNSRVVISLFGFQSLDSTPRNDLAQLPCAADFQFRFFWLSFIVLSADQFVP